MVKTAMSPAGNGNGRSLVSGRCFMAERREAPGGPESGFTLLELLIVMTIIGIIYAVLPGGLFSSTASLEVRSTARDIADSLRRARGQAIAENKEVVFFLDLRERRYGILDEATERRFRDDIDIRFTTAREELRSEGEGAIRFFPDGSATGGVVTVEGARQKMQVKVRWLTGQVAFAQ